MTAYQFALAYLLDLALGDPKYFPHPVRGIGFLIRIFGKVLRWPSARPSWEKVAGLLLALGLPTGIFLITYWLIGWMRLVHPWAGSLLTIILAYTTLATRSLHQEASLVVRALKEGRSLRGPKKVKPHRRS